MAALFTQQATLWCCAGLLMWAAVSDLRSYLIPNRIVLAIIALYPIYCLSGYLGGMPVDWSGGVLGAALVFALGFTIFSMGMVGGGDVKLAAAVALWTGLGWLVMLGLIVGLAGGLLSIGIISARTLTIMRMPTELRVAVYPYGRFNTFRAILQTPAPYGAAIAFGGLFIIYRLLSSTLP